METTTNPEAKMNAIITLDGEIQITETTQTPIATVAIPLDRHGEPKIKQIRSALLADLTLAGKNPLEARDAINAASETLGFSLWG